MLLYLICIRQLVYVEERFSLLLLSLSQKPPFFTVFIPIISLTWEWEKIGGQPDTGEKILKVFNTAPLVGLA